MKIILSPICSKFYQLSLPLSSSQKYYLLFLFYSHIITNLSFIILDHETSNNYTCECPIIPRIMLANKIIKMHQCYTECIDRVHQFYNASCYSASMLQSACINIQNCYRVHQCYSTWLLQCNDATISENVTVQLLQYDYSTFLLWSFSLMKSVEML